VLSTEQNAFFRMFGEGALTNELREARDQDAGTPPLGPRADRAPEPAVEGSAN
jgi:hypothetical protein